MMKIKWIKKTAAILSLTMVLALGGCGNKGEQKHQSGVPSLPGFGTTEQAGPGSTTEELTVEPDTKEYAEKENEEFEAYLDQQFRDYAEADTMTFNYSVKDEKSFGFSKPETATIGDASLSDETFEENRKKAQENYDELLKFEDAELTFEEAFIYEWLKINAETALSVNDKKYQWFFEPLSPMNGYHSEVPLMFIDYRFDDKADVEDYITMLGQLGNLYDQCIDYEKRKSDAGYFMSDTNADSVVKQIDSFIGDNPKDNYMISVFNSHMDELSFLSQAEKEDFKKRNEDAVINTVIPAFQRMKECMTSLKGTCKTTFGALCEYDGGKEYYAMLVKEYAGTDKTPDEIAAYLDEKLSATMSSFTTLYLSDPEGYQAFLGVYGDIFKDTDKMDVTEELREIEDIAMEEYPDAGEIKFSAYHMTPAEQKVMEHAMAYYMHPAADDPEGNIIYINDSFEKGHWTTLAHEGCPGHMYQHMYCANVAKVHPIMTTSNELGYKEGWAMYAAYSTLEAYFEKYYGPEHAELFATLTMENESLGYAVYGRIDVGVNYEGWTLEDAKDYFSQYGMDEEALQEVINTCAGDPGVYLSYSEGYYEMQDLRTYAEEQLGDKFDPVEYHAAVLSMGPCKFSQLKKLVDRYITEKQK